MMRGTKVPDLTYAQLRKKYTVTHDKNHHRTQARRAAAEAQVTKLYAPDGTHLGFMAGGLPYRDLTDALRRVRRNACGQKARES